jgi:hypothetical protein
MGLRNSLIPPPAHITPLSFDNSPWWPSPFKSAAPHRRPRIGAGAAMTIHAGGSPRKRKMRFWHT